MISSERTSYHTEEVAGGTYTTRKDDLGFLDQVYHSEEVLE
jgi:hypothetical protein